MFISSYGVLFFSNLPAAQNQTMPSLPLTCVAILNAPFGVHSISGRFGRLWEFTQFEGLEFKKGPKEKGPPKSYSILKNRPHYDLVNVVSGERAG